MSGRATISGRKGEKSRKVMPRRRVEGTATTQRGRSRRSGRTVFDRGKKVSKAPKTKRTSNPHTRGQEANEKLDDIIRSLRTSASHDGSNERRGRRKRQRDGHFHYHDYAIFIVHYHKTGYVLSRELKHLVQDIEVAATGRSKKDVNHVKFETSGYDEDKKERFAFTQMGNWARSAFPQRRHGKDVPCMSVWRPGRSNDTVFRLKKGSIYVQESPDLFCGEEEILRSLSSAKGGTKIIHFVRGAYDTALSNYFYHAQDPTPEVWVHRDDPCEYQYQDGASLSSHVVPTLARWANDTAGATAVTQQQMDGIVSMCQSIYQSGRKLNNATFYEHLRELSKEDGLRLATAQMTVASGVANKHLAGGDLLRMANNVAQFEKLQKDPNVHLLTVSMDDFIRNTTKGTLQFLDFVFGPDNPVITDQMQLEAAVWQTDKYEQKKQHSHHVTQNAKTDKEALREMLRTDEHLGPVLNLTEMLVNEALSMS
ncbi:hypothetical protein ACHAXT_008893 [Thalassiosira profunda]